MITMSQVPKPSPANLNALTKVAAIGLCPTRGIAQATEQSRNAHEHARTRTHAHIAVSQSRTHARARAYTRRRPDRRG